MVQVSCAISIVLAGIALALAAPASDHHKNCLCIFDVDRTLTGQQKVGESSPCKKNEVMPNITDTAYGGGALALSEVGRSLHGTFCAACYVGIVSAGDAGAAGSAERAELVKRLSGHGKLVSTHWSGPSKEKEARRDCKAADAKSTLMLGCNDGTKQEAVKGIVAWLAHHHHHHHNHSVAILPKNVWHFDDRENNIAPFKGTGFNARMISCGTREKHGIGLCGATKAEIVNKKGVALCSHDAEIVV